MSTVLIKQPNKWVYLGAACLLAISIVFTLSCGNSTDDPNSQNQPSPVGSAALNIPPTFQQTIQWCWAASATMVLQYYELPSLNNADYQCGVVAVWYFNPQCAFNCFLCPLPIDSMSSLHQLITNYGSVVTRLTGQPSRDLRASLGFFPLSASQVKAEIDSGRPIIIGLTPGGFPIPNSSAHAAVITGYDFTGPIQTVTVNDPFPFDLVQFLGTPNPYTSHGGVQVSQGQYNIALQSLTHDLVWANTIYNIQ